MNHYYLSQKMKKYINRIKDIVINDLKNENIKIFLFGSRARKTNYSYSDVDIGIIPYGQFDEKKITLIKEKLENSNIPYKIEIVNFNHVSEDFKQEATKDIEIWKD